MKRIIINADDCGYSDYVNASIETSIVKGKITSTTIMANMSGFEGAVALYKKYHDVISFGWHINLTEGEPLTYSQFLLDNGFYKEVEGKIVFNGKDFWKKYPSNLMLKEIERELDAQYSKIKDFSINVSHADSHHHFHTCRGFILFFPTYFKNTGICKCRKIRDFVPSKANKLVRNLCMAPFKLRGIRMPDYFGSFKDYYDNPIDDKKSTIELMCHPGHPKQVYVEELRLLESFDYNAFNAKLITFNDL